MKPSSSSDAVFADAERERRVSEMWQAAYGETYEMVFVDLLPVVREQPSLDAGTAGCEEACEVQV